MNRPRPRVTGWAVLAAATVTAISGCLTDSNAESPAQVSKQAGMVSLLISNAMGTGRLTEAGILPLTAGEFAAGHGRAALALRLHAGGCIYLSLPDNPDGGGLPGPWLSPVQAPCTGASAMAASGWISNNPAAGG